MALSRAMPNTLFIHARWIQGHQTGKPHRQSRNRQDTSGIGSSHLDNISPYDMILLARPDRGAQQPRHWLSARRCRRRKFRPICSRFSTTWPLSNDVLGHTVRNSNLSKICRRANGWRLVRWPLSVGAAYRTVISLSTRRRTSPHEVKTIITRAGEGTKMVFTCDIANSFAPSHMQSNGLAYLTHKMKGQDLFAHINLVKGERSYLLNWQVIYSERWFKNVESKRIFWRSG